MSIYSFLCCTDCKVSLWLGKAVFVDKERTKISKFQMGPDGSCPNHMNHILTMALWKMLADHHGHGIHTYFDYQYDRLPDRNNYQEIGGESDNDIPLDVYIDKWSALTEKQ